MRKVWTGLVVVLVACSGAEPTAGQACGACAAGEICEAGRCVAVTPECEPACGPGQTCDRATRTCVPPPPTISAIDGTGSADPDAAHAPRHLRDRLLVRGTSLSGAAFTLRGLVPASAGVTLTPCGPGSDTEIELALPTTLAAGQYVLTAANQAGSCDASVTLLQGEPGQDGAGLPGLISTLSATASASSPSLRSVLVHGVEQVTDSTTAGLALVVIDLASHTVIDQPVGAIFTTHMSFAADDAVQRLGLRDVLASLTPSEAVVLVSGGDISAMPADAAADLGTLLREFGASSLFDELTAAQGYALVGVRGLGEGGGLERLSGSAEGDPVSIATLLMNEGVVGSSTKPAAEARYLNATGDVVSGALTFAANPVFNDGAIPGRKLVPGSVTAAEVSFNYAASSAQGGAALDVACAACIDAGELAFNYAASATQGGAASDLACADCVGNAEIADVSWSKVTGVPAGFADGVDDGLLAESDPSVNELGKATLGCAIGQVAKFDGSLWSCADDAGAAGGPPSSDVVCTGCVSSGDIADATVSGADIADGSVVAADVAFSYAGSTSKGGAASDLACAGCVALGTETTGSYDATPDSIADDGAISGGEITDGSIAAIDVGFAYAGSASAGGAAEDVACAGCVALGTETSGSYDSTPDTIADDGSIGPSEVSFNFAAGATKGGAATDLSCAACVVLGTETSGSYDSTPDSIADDGAISGAEITDGSVASADVGFNYAGSAGKGGAASDLSCTGCVALGTETSGTFDATTDTIADDGAISGGEITDGSVTGTDIADGSIGAADVTIAYAGSATQGGPAADLACTACVGPLEVSFAYAGSVSAGGAASDVACAGCVALGSETSGTYDSTADTIADDGAISSAEISDGTIVNADLGVNYAGSTSKGGPASDLSCTSCVSAGEIARAGLDADLLDGQDASAFATATALSALDARVGSAEVALADRTTRIVRLEEEVVGPLAFGFTGRVEGYDGFSFHHTFSALPALVLSLYEVDDSGGTEVRVNNLWRNGASVQVYNVGNVAADGMFWLGVEPGSYTIGGRSLQAGRQASGGANTFAVNYSVAFTTTPVVIVTPEEIGSNGGAITCRLQTSNAAGFTVQCYVDGSPNVPEGVFWVALAPTAASPISWNGHTIQAGITNVASAPTGTITFPTAFTSPPIVLVTGHDTNNSGDTAIRVNYNVSRTSFPYRSQVPGVASNGFELVNWIAID